MKDLRFDETEEKAARTSPSDDRQEAPLAQSNQGSLETDRARNRPRSLPLCLSSRHGDLEPIQLAAPAAILPGRNYSFPTSLAEKSSSASSSLAVGYPHRSLLETRSPVSDGIVAHQIEAPTFVMIRVTAHSVLIINTALIVIPGEFLSETEPANLSPPRRQNGG